MSGDSFIGGAQADTVGTNLGQGSAYVFSTGQRVSIANASVAEGNSGTTQLTFTVALSAADTHPVNVDYATRDRGATAGSDYVATSGTLTFNPGETSKTINVTVNGDTHFESDEPFLMILSNSVNANLNINTLRPPVERSSMMTLHQPSSSARRITACKKIALLSLLL